MRKFFDLRVFYEISPEIPKHCVATVGFFDGVHLGHKYIIEQIKQNAKSAGVEELVITMNPHPAEYFGRGIDLLSPMQEKLVLFDRCGVKNILVLPFNSELASLTGTQFIDNLLVEKLSVSKLMLGYNNSIGRKINGVAEIKSEKIPVVRLEKFSLEPSDDISSSSIRNHLAEGNVELANRYLGYEYELEGKVVHGFGIGRKIDFPTANICPTDARKCIPENGAYIVSADIDGKLYPAMLNIGVRPTFGENGRSIELNVIDYAGDLYESHIKIFFKKRLRGEQKFDSIEKLVAQLNNDRTQVVDYFAKYPLSLS